MLEHAAESGFTFDRPRPRPVTTGDRRCVPDALMRPEAMVVVHELGDEAASPTLKKFRTWFAVEIHADVFDACLDPLHLL